MAARVGKTLGSSASAPNINSSITRTLGGKQAQIKYARPHPDRVRLERMLTRATCVPSSEPKRPPGGAPRAVRSSRGDAPSTPGDYEPGLPSKTGMVARTLSQSLPRISAINASRADTEGSVPSPPVGKKLAQDGSRSPHTDRASQFVRKLLGQAGDNAGPQDWRLVQEIDAVDHFVQEDRERRHMQKRKQALHTYLGKQQHEAKNQQLRTREEQRRWGTKLQQDADRFWEEEAIKRREASEAQRRFNQEQAQHLEATKQRRQEEQERDREMERQMHDRAVQAKQIEAAREEERRKKHQAAAAEIMEEAKQAVARRSEKRRDEALRDVEMLRVQQETLERQEQHRVQHFDSIRQRQTSLQGNYQAAVGSALEKSQQEAEERAKRQMAERILKQKQAEEEKQRQVKQHNIDSQAVLTRQLEEKSQKRAREREESVRAAQEFQRNARAAIDEETKKQQERREKEKENARFLLAQIEQRSNLGRFGHEEMNKVEKSMNRDRLDRAKEDDTLQLLFRAKQIHYKDAKLS